jgi:hypothetical protein
MIDRRSSKPSAKLIRSSFGLVLIVAWTLMSAAQTPPATGWKWYKGNLHTHTINSDGDSAPDAVTRWYKEHRYNFLVLTDHDFVTPTAGLSAIFAAEDRFLLISGEEISPRFGDKPIHVNGLDIHRTIQPIVGTSVVDTLQKNVDAVRAAGGTPSLNHPNVRWAVTAGELGQIHGLKHFEVYNGHSRTNDAGGGGFPSLEEMWDAVLSAGREVYGIAVDDAHKFKVFGPEYSNPGRGWVSVKAPELSTEAILSSLNSGEFYASTGVVLDDVSRAPNELRVYLVEDEQQEFTTEFIGQGGRLLSTSFDNPAVYTLKPGDTYVRAKVTSSNAEYAWVQPIFAAAAGSR